MLFCKWIVSALDAISKPTNEVSSAYSPRANALSSDEFLAAGLKIAHSLAREICQAEECGDCNTEKSRLPIPDDDWAAHVVVAVSAPTDSNGNCADDEQISYSESPPIKSVKEIDGLDSQPSEIINQELNQLSEGVQNEDDLLSLFGQFEPLFDNKCLEQVYDVDRDQDGGNCLSVTSATLLQSSFSSDTKFGGGTSNEESERIYSLALIMYEIFSGGMKPLEQGDYEPLAFHERSGSTFDLANALHIVDDLNNIADCNLEDEDDEQQGPKKKAAICLDSRCSVSVEPLKAMGLPWSLCNLIANMLDSVNGDLSGDESYRSMRNVCDDLQLMLDSPDIYLKDIDLSEPSLPFDEAIFGRESLFRTLQESYTRSISGNNELVIISGPSGTGKSVLAKRLGSFITGAAESGQARRPVPETTMFLIGKFDQHQKATSPFSAIAAAFNQYCDLLKKKSPNYISSVMNKLDSVLGKDGLLTLTRAGFHSLRDFGSFTPREERDGEGKGCVDAQKRLQYLLCQFVTVIISFSDSITLALDDLQWADEDQIELIQGILLASNHSKQFFFVGCCRDEAVDQGDHRVSKILATLSTQKVGVQVTKVKLACMDEPTINTLVSRKLCIMPRITMPLSNVIYRRTKGNPLYFSSLMKSLYKDGSVRLSLNRRQWMWDMERIQSKAMPKSVVEFFASTIEQLPSNTQSSLSLLSFFGCSVEASIVNILESELHSSLIEPLEAAVEEGLLDKSSDGRTYSFCHDRIQEAAFNFVKAQDRVLRHIEYGTILADAALRREGDDDLLFIAAKQMNMGGPAAVQDAAKGLIIAGLNLDVGKKAMQMSDFHSAYNFFDHGISFLKKGHWRHNYELTLCLFDHAAKCAFSIADFVSLDLLTKQVLHFAKTYDEKINVLYCSIGALAHANKLDACITKATEVLCNLGEKIPESFTELELKSQIDLTRGIISGFTDEQLLAYKEMKSAAKLQVMKFCARIEQVLQNSRPQLQPIVTLKMVQMTLAHGLGPESAVGFAYYGMLLARTGHIREGHRFARLAKKLLTKFPLAAAGEVICIATQIACFVESVQSAKEFHLDGYNAAMASGDLSNAMTNIMFYAVCSFGDGTHLQKVKENCTNARLLMERHNNLAWLTVLAPVERSLLKLIGTCDVGMSGDSQKSSPYPSLVNVLNNMFTSFTFREFDQMKENAEKYHASTKLKSWSLLYSHISHERFGGLSSFWIYRRTKDQVWLERGKKSKSLVKEWLNSAKWNTEATYFLLDAEDHFCNGNVENAKSSYEKSIASAIEHRCVYEEALAFELAGYFYLEQHQQDISLDYLSKSHGKFMEWGAVAKCDALFQYTMQTFSLQSHVAMASTPTSRLGEERETPSPEQPVC